jgi:hypothetical protein
LALSIVTNPLASKRKQQKMTTFVGVVAMKETGYSFGIWQFHQQGCSHVHIPKKYKYQADTKDDCSGKGLKIWLKNLRILNFEPH